MGKGNLAVRLSAAAFCATAAADAQEAVKVTASSLNVRTGPSSSYQIIGQVSSGQIYVSVGSSGSWKKIWYSDATGWVYGPYTTPATATVATVTASSVNVRTGPGSGYASRGSAPGGSTWAIVAASGDWRRVWWKSGEGWIYKNWLSTSSAPPSPGAEDKYLLVATDSAYQSAASAEGYTANSHATAILDTLRGYLSDGSKFWITFNKGLKFATWSSPGEGSSSGTFLDDLSNDFTASDSTAHALCLGITGKRSTANVMGIGYVGTGWIARHAVLFYRETKEIAASWGADRFKWARSTASHEFGHNFSEDGHHYDGDSSVAKSGPCSLDRDHVHTYCGNHLTKFYNYQKARGTAW